MKFDGRIEARIADCGVYVDYTFDNDRIAIDRVEPFGSTGNIYGALHKDALTQLFRACVHDVENVLKYHKGKVVQLPMRGQA